jgi:hypothetical protein
MLFTVAGPPAPVHATAPAMVCTMIVPPALRPTNAISAGSAGPALDVTVNVSAASL